MNAFPALLTFLFMFLAVVALLSFIAILLGGTALIVGMIIGLPVYLCLMFLRGVWWVCCWPSNYLARRQKEALKEFK